jgi:Ca-activated chloride channel family protein
MLEWASPLWFAALPLVLLPWLAWWRPHAIRFSAVGSLATGWSVRRVLALVPPLLASATLALVVFSLARPQQVERETIRESDGIDILLAIDTSGSMSAGDMGTNVRQLTRLDAARLVMRQFVEGRPNDRLGLLVFGEEAFVQVPLTTDHDGLVNFIGDLDIGLAGRNATAVGDAVAVACKRMKELSAPSKVVILVTDGRSNAGVLSPQQAADAAAALGIRIYTVGVGGDQMDERQLRAIATTTGAKFYRATDVNDLAQVYADIDTLEKSTAKVKEYVHRDELYLDLLLPGLACFVLDLLLGHTLLRRLP